MSDDRRDAELWRMDKGSEQLATLEAHCAALREAWERYRAAWNDFAVTLPMTEASKVGGENCDEALLQLAAAFTDIAAAATAYTERIRREGWLAGRNAAMAVAHEKAADYESDWSSPEFNYANDVEQAIAKLEPPTPGAGTPT